jgi:DNA-directed RNA polymerase specialized sigma24 family protein
MTPLSSVTTWIGRLKAGDMEAANQLWMRYYAQLVELARQHLDGRIRRVADEEDVALSAFARFCAGAAGGRYLRLDDRRDLWRLLFTLTLRRARYLPDREAREKRDARRALPADLLELPGVDLDRLAGDSPDPALAAELADELRTALTLLPGDDLRAVAGDLLEGYTAVEIANRQGCGLRTVERRWQRIRQFWQARAEKRT